MLKGVSSVELVLFTAITKSFTDTETRMGHFFPPGKIIELDSNHVNWRNLKSLFQNFMLLMKELRALKWLNDLVKVSSFVSVYLSDQIP